MRAVRPYFRSFLFRLLLLLPIYALQAQEPEQAVSFQWEYIQGDTGICRKVFSEHYCSLEEARRAVASCLDSLLAAGYLAARLLSFDCEDSLCRASLFVGPRFRWVQLRTAGLSDQLLSKSGFRQKKVSHKPLSYEEIKTFQRRILRQAAEQGYPLASIRLDSLSFEPDGQSRATLVFESGPLIRYGKPDIRGDAGISPDMLGRLLHLPEGKVYRQKEVDELLQTLQALPYLQVAAPPQWLFSADVATPILQLKKRKASSFDFIFGLNAGSNPGAPRFSFTGQLRADFFNAFRQGERFQAQYEQLPSGTKKLSVKLWYPFIGPLPLGGNARFEQFKQDTSFSDLLWRIGLSYPLRATQFVSMYWQGSSSTIITTDTSQIKQTHQLPSRLDVERRGLGIEMQLGKLDMPFNPRRGWRLKTDFSFSRKRTPVNPLIAGLTDAEEPEFDFASLYDSIPTQVAQARIRLDVGFYLPLFQSSSLGLSLKAGHFYSKTALYQNELFQLGGYYSLRGFDERSLLASSYLIWTAEYRWITGPDSRFYLFVDYGWLEENSVAAYFTEHPLGIGAGLTFATPAGQLAVNLAFGARQGQQPDWRSPKIHLGYVGRF